MDDAMIAGQLENLNRRLARAVQILPTLPTRDELHGAIAAAVAPFATKEELRPAIAPLVTRQELDERLAAQSAELRQAIRDEGERSRRHMDVLMEGQRGDIQLLAEHLSVVMSRLIGT